MTDAATPSDIKLEMTRYFASILRVPVQQIDTSVHILELGVDSIMLIEAQRWMKSRFGCVIEVQQLFEDLNTIDRLAAHVAALHPAASSAAVVPPESMPARPLNRAASGHDYGLLRSQLALIGDVIDAQNRLLMSRNPPKARPDDA